MCPLLSLGEEEISFPPTYRYERGSRDTYAWHKQKPTGVSGNYRLGEPSFWFQGVRRWDAKDRVSAIYFSVCGFPEAFRVMLAILGIQGRRRLLGPGAEEEWGFVSSGWDPSETPSSQD